MIYDAVIMVTPDNISLLKTSCRYLINNLRAGKIIFVANKKCSAEIEGQFESFKKIQFLDEEEIMDGLTVNRIKSILEVICGDSSRAGWFYQQFLKMAYAFKSEWEYYLLFDSDTIPLNPISYFDDTGTPQFIVKSEYHKPYFDTMRVLFDGKVGRVEKEISYISENMIIKKDIMIEIIDKIMDNPHLTGATFYERIFNSINRDIVKNTGFSEFETYGNYVMTYYPDMYNKVKLRTQRRGAFLFGRLPSPEQLDWASKDYDIISIENHGKTWLAEKTKDEKIRKRYTADRLFRKYIWLNDLCDFIRGREVIKYDS